MVNIAQSAWPTPLAYGHAPLTTTPPSTGLISPNAAATGAQEWHSVAAEHLGETAGGQRRCSSATGAGVVERHPARRRIRVRERFDHPCLIGKPEFIAAHVDGRLDERDLQVAKQAHESRRRRSQSLRRLRFGIKRCGHLANLIQHLFDGARHPRTLLTTRFAVAIRPRYSAVPMSTDPSLPALDDYRDSARAWLAARAQSKVAGDEAWGSGSESVAVFHDLTEAEEDELDRNIRAWHRAELADGFALTTWPAHYGGQAMPSAYERAYAEEESRFVTPPEHEAFGVTVRLVAPTIEVYGTDEQKQRYIPSFLRADELCCQLFSEPEAGSDLASLRTRATLDATTWRIDGQKVWTSGARLCDFGLLIARSDPDAPQHRGMTAFLMPLDAPGVEVRPIRQMTGGASFNEVFMSGVELDDSMRLGPVGEGWKVALATLGFERNTSADDSGSGGSWQQVLALARHLGRANDLATRQELAQLYTLFRIGELSGIRMRGAQRSGQDPGPLGSVGKLAWVQRLIYISDVVSGLLGPRLVADTGEWGTYAWREHVLGAPGYRIAGGSDEIQRNIIGERVLGLPREPRQG